MIDLTTEPAELHFTVSITRKETGKVETYDMVGHTNPEAIKQLIMIVSADSTATSLPELVIDVING